MIIRRNDAATAEKHTFMANVKPGKEYYVYCNDTDSSKHILDDYNCLVFISHGLIDLYFVAVKEVAKPWPQVGAMTTKGKVLANYKGYTWVLVDGIPATFLTSNLEKPKPTLAEFIDEYLHSHTDTPLIRLDLIRDAIGDYENG